MIEIRDLYKSFGEKQVARGINLKIYTGESLTIIGQSGSGKSVLLKHMVGLLKPDSGDLLVDDRSVVTAKRRELYEIRMTFWSVGLCMVKLLTFTGVYGPRSHD